MDRKVDAGIGEDQYLEQGEAPPSRRLWRVDSPSPGTYRLGVKLADGQVLLQKRVTPEQNSGVTLISSRRWLAP